MKVEHFLSKNQFRLYENDTNILQSYDSKVVEITNNGSLQKIVLGCDWDYSTATSKYVYAFLEQYSKVRFCGRTNKRKYIRDLIKECQKDSYNFLKENRYKIVYDENMI